MVRLELKFPTEFPLARKGYIETELTPLETGIPFHLSSTLSGLKITFYEIGYFFPLTTIGLSNPCRSFMLVLRKRTRSAVSSAGNVKVIVVLPGFPEAGWTMLVVTAVMIFCFP